MRKWPHGFNDIGNSAKPANRKGMYIDSNEAGKLGKCKNVIKKDQQYKEKTVDRFILRCLTYKVFQKQER